MKKLVLAGLGLALSVGLCGVGLAAEGSSVTVSGHLRDAFCYNAMGAHGPSHKKCAIECAKNGIPVALEEKDGKQIVLLPKKNAEALPDDVINKMEEEVTLTGKEYQKGGVTYLQVESVK
jgi:hypothetical protein